MIGEEDEIIDSLIAQRDVAYRKNTELQRELTRLRRRTEALQAQASILHSNLQALHADLLLLAPVGTMELLAERDGGLNPT